MSARRLPPGCQEAASWQKNPASRTLPAARVPRGPIRHYFRTTTNNEKQVSHMRSCAAIGWNINIVVQEYNRNRSTET